MKRVTIAQTEGKDWKDEVGKYLVAYRSTPHTTSGVSPAEVLFGRKNANKTTGIEGGSDGKQGARHAETVKL